MTKAEQAVWVMRLNVMLGTIKQMQLTLEELRDDFRRDAQQIEARVQQAKDAGRPSIVERA